MKSKHLSIEFSQNGAAPQPTLHGPRSSFFEGSVSNPCFFCTLENVTTKAPRHQEFFYNKPLGVPLCLRAFVAIFMAVHHEGATAGPRPETMKM